MADMMTRMASWLVVCQNPFSLPSLICIYGGGGELGEVNEVFAFEVQIVAGKPQGTMFRI